MAAHDQSSDDAKLKLYVDGAEVVHFPVTVNGNELLLVKAVFPSGELILCVCTFYRFAV